MAKAIINKHIDNENELNNSLFISDNEHSKGEIVICNDKNNPSIYIKDTEGNITKIAGDSNDNEPYDDSELREQISANTNDIKELKEKECFVNISESEVEKTESKEEINKNFLEYEDEENGSKSLAVRSIDTDATILQKDITVAGIKGTLGSGNYKNGDIIQKGTSIYEIIQNILCQEQYPENVSEIKAKANVSLKDLTLTLNYSNNDIVEVGTLIKLVKGSTNDTKCVSSNSIVSGMTNGYSYENDNEKDSEDTEIEKECFTSISNNDYTISATIDSGFDADTTTNVKTTPETQTGNGSASLNETNLGCVVEGENKITISATGASYSYHADAIDKVYYCSNLGNTDENKYSTGVTSVSGTTIKPTNSTNKTIIGKYYYYLGYSEKTSFNQLNSDDIKSLNVKLDWISLNDDEKCIVVGDNKIKTNGQSIVFACPSKYKLNNFDDGFGTSLLEKFTSKGEINVKTGLIYTPYNVYVYPITNHSVFEIKNIIITNNN